MDYLINMDTHDKIDQKLKSMKIVALYRIRRGTAHERRSEVRDWSGVFYECRSREEGLESAIWMDEDPEAVNTIDWSEVCTITQLGASVGHWAARIIQLPDPLDTSYTTYQVSEEQLVINLLPPFKEDWEGGSKRKAEGHFSGLQRATRGANAS